MHRRHLGAVGRWAYLALALVLTVFPLYWTFVIATRPPVASFGTPEFIFEPDFSALVAVWESNGFIQAALMSLGTVLLTVAVTLVITVPAAYILTRRNVRGHVGLVAWLFIAYLFPDFLIAIPMYAILQNVGLFDTPAGLALAYQGFMVPLSMWLLLAFFAAIPDELAQASTLDGCTAWGTLRHIYLPLVVPGIATVAILMAVEIWNEVTIALALTSQNPTVPIVVASFKGYAAMQWDKLGSASLISMVPVIIFAVFAQRYIVRGLTAGIER